MTRNWLGKSYVPALAIGLCIAASPLKAQDRPQFEPAFLDVVHLTCKEVWLGVNKNEKMFYQVVETLTHHILKKREQTFPKDEEAGKLYGEAISAYCLDDPYELLFSVVARSLYDLLVPPEETAKPTE